MIVLYVLIVLAVARVGLVAGELFDIYQEKQS